METRRVPRWANTKVHPVMLHRDGPKLSYERATERASRRIMRGRPSDLQAELADTSEGGLRLRFRGQRSRAENLLRCDGKYWLRISLRNAMEQTPRRLIRGRDDPFVLVRTICRWHRPGADMGLSAAGFVLDPSTDPEVVAFITSGLGEQFEASTSGLDDLPFGVT